MSEKSLNAIEEMAKEIHSLKTYDTYWADECRELASDLYARGWRKQSGWISVVERLPDKYGDYICCTQKGTIWQLTYNPKYKLFNVSHDNVENAMNVTHWMPLPEAPKKKGE